MGSLNNPAQLSRMRQLAESISKSVAELDDLLATQGVESPSFDEHSSTEYPTEASDLRDIVVDASGELHDLLMDPVSLLMQRSGCYNQICLQLIGRLDIAKLVPAGGMISYRELAETTGYDESALKRVLRYAVSLRIFREREPGMIARNKLSELLSQPHYRDWAYVSSEEMWPAATRYLDAVEKWPNSQALDETAYFLSNNESKSIYESIGSSTEKAVKFANSMKTFMDNPSLAVKHVVESFDWASLGAARIVDIGGSRGQVAAELLEAFPKLTAVVQDMPQVIQGAEDDLPEAIRSRVSFEAHDFFEVQKTEADLYLLRWVLHNWSDQCVVGILRAQVPALGSSSRLLIQEACMPEPGEMALWREKELRHSDLCMASAFNARERSLGEWKKLLEQADARFHLEQVVTPKGSNLSLLVVRFLGGQADGSINQQPERGRGENGSMDERLPLSRICHQGSSAERCEEASWVGTRSSGALLR